MNRTFGYKQIPVKTWFLTFEGALPDISSFDDTIQLKQWETPDADDYLKLYTEVGGIWGWTGRLLKTRDELESILKSTNNEVWLFIIKNEIAGFFELVRSETETEIVYLGLKPGWIGNGYGQKLIRSAIAKAGQNGETVWLHTCERDHVSALVVYQKAGFKIKEERISMEYYPE